MLQKGCKRILLMRDLRHASTIRNRKAGYLEALQEADDRVTNGSVVLSFLLFFDIKFQYGKWLVWTFTMRYAILFWRK